MFRISKSLATSVKQIRLPTQRTRSCVTKLLIFARFRGFGGPQAMLVVETWMDHLSKELNMDPVTLRVCVGRPCIADAMNRS